MSQRHLAFDVGGANIKLATTDGFTASRPFALWKYPDRLAQELTSLIDIAPSCDRIAATMTGELADCFATKQEGVEAIIGALTQSAAGRPVSIYLTDGTFVTTEEARGLPLLAAASNWHALASYATRLAGEQDAILVDIGSTTCDVIPIREGLVAARGTTDTQRLLAHELVYLGIERTPVCSVSSTVPYRDHECPVARELFATTLDVHLLTGDIAERPRDTDTADGRPATRQHALARLARIVCADNQEFTMNDGQAMAEYISFEMSELLGDAIETVIRRNRMSHSALIILSGHGDFLLHRASTRNARIVSLSESIGSNAAKCAPAFAIAKLADEQI